MRVLRWMATAVVCVLIPLICFAVVVWRGSLCVARFAWSTLRLLWLIAGDVIHPEPRHHR